MVKDDSPNKPFLQIEISNAGDEEKLEYIMFEAVVPPESIFEVPEQCP